jgi:hypothetical protein
MWLKPLLTSVSAEKGAGSSSIGLCPEHCRMDNVLNDPNL